MPSRVAFLRETASEANGDAVAFLREVVNVVNGDAGVNDMPGACQSRGVTDPRGDGGTDAVRQT